ncbi:MAG: hypothetical protein H6824_18875 [Planctomycetaceae bacterium]|nr:hypothetical protein [Planctomycetaceae bacterium]
MLFQFLKNLIRQPTRRSQANAYCLEALEGRTLLSSVGLLAAPGARLVVTGGNEANDFLVSYNEGTGNYRVEDRSGTPLNATQLLAGLDIAPEANVVEFNAVQAELLADFTRIQINPGLGDDVVTIDSMRTGNEGLHVIDGRNQGIDTIIVNSDLGSAANPILSDSILLRSEYVQLGGDVYTDNRPLGFGGTLGANLLGDRQIHVGTASASFEVHTTSSHHLEVSARLVDIKVELNVESLDVSTDILSGGRINILGGDGNLHVNKWNLFQEITGAGHLTVARRTVGNQTFKPADLNFIRPGFQSITVGSELTQRLVIADDRDNNPDTGSLHLGADVQFVAESMVIFDNILQTDHELVFNTNSFVTFMGAGRVINASQVEFRPGSSATSLAVIGDIGNGWGPSRLVVNAPDVDVTFTGGVGSSFSSIDMVGSSLAFPAASAVVAQGDVRLQANVIWLNGGVFSEHGDIDISGDVQLTGNALFKVPGGHLLHVDGTVAANEHNVITRSFNGAAEGILFSGPVTNAGYFYVDSNRANLAANVSVPTVDAAAIILRGSNVELYGDLISRSLIQVVGNTTLHHDVAMTSGGETRDLIQLIGDVNAGTEGGQSLSMDANLARVYLIGNVGMTTPLETLTVRSLSNNVISANIQVTDTFEWFSGTCQLIVPQGRTISAGSRATLTYGSGGVKGRVLVGGVEVSV